MGHLRLRVKYVFSSERVYTLMVFVNHPRWQAASAEMIETLKKLRKKVAVGFVSGSDLPKIKEQLEVPGTDCKFILAPLKLFSEYKYSACRHGLLFLREWPDRI